MPSTTRRRCTTGLLVLLVAGTGAATVAPAVARAEPAPTRAAPTGARASLSPGSGPAGSLVTVRGSGFAAEETVVVTFEDDTYTSARTTTTGAFTARIGVPREATPGSHQVYVTGTQSHRATTMPFLVRDNWTQGGGTPDHALNQAGSSTLLTTANVGNLERSWDAGIGNTNTANAAVVSDGTVYATSGTQLAAFDQRTGAVRWRATAPGVSVGSPAVVGGNLVTMLRTGTVVAYGIAGGHESWRFVGAAGAQQGIAVTGTTVLGGLQNGTAFALDADSGVATWSAAGTGAVTAVPTVGDGVVVVARGKALAAYVTTTGAPKWTTSLGSAVTAAPTWSSFTGMLLVPSQRSGFYGIDARTGRTTWQATGFTSLSSTTTSFGSAWVVRSSGSGFEILVIDPLTGRISESVGTIPVLPSSGLTLAGDLLVFTGSGGGVYATRAYAGSTPMVQWTRTSARSTQPVAVVDGTLVFASVAGAVSRYTMG